MKKRAFKIRWIVIHCSAGFGDIPSIQRYWKLELGWKSPGYHIIIEQDGTRWYVTKDGNYSKKLEDWCPDLVTNGVQGWNNESLHICYIGGVEKVNGKWIGKDTRTDAQKAGIIYSIIDSFKWLQEEGVDTSTEKIGIVGHRDFSPDKNLNGMIDANERIKECPSYNCIEEYSWITWKSGQKKVNLPKK